MSRLTEKIHRDNLNFKNYSNDMNRESLYDYTLEFVEGPKKGSLNYKETIVVPYILLGRDRNCIISFDNSFIMVSRKHAAIEKIGNDFLLKHLSSTNQTFLNGIPIEESWFLNDGDEIQLSTSGPKFIFKVTQQKTGAAGFTKRLQLYSHQALKPYKNAIIALIILLIIGVGVSAFYFYRLRKENNKITKAYSLIEVQKKKQMEASKRGDLEFLEKQKGSALKLSEANKENAKLQEEIKTMKSLLDIQKSKSLQKNKIENESADIIPSSFKHIVKNIYQLKVYFSFEGEIEKNLIYTGTGIKLENGKLVTSRQCIQPWLYTDLKKRNLSEKKWLMFNWLYYNSPKGKAAFTIEIISPDGKAMAVSAEKFVFKDGTDFHYENIDFGYGPGKLQLADKECGNDVAYYSFGFSNKVPESILMNSKVPYKGSILHVAGYSQSQKENANEFKLQYHIAKVIPTTNSKDYTYLQANDSTVLSNGSPVFIQNGGKFEMIGITSGCQGNIGKIIPVDNMLDDKTAM